MTTNDIAIAVLVVADIGVAWAYCKWSPKFNRRHHYDEFTDED